MHILYVYRNPTKIYLPQASKLDCTENSEKTVSKFTWADWFWILKYLLFHMWLHHSYNAFHQVCIHKLDKKIITFYNSELRSIVYASVIHNQTGRCLFRLKICCIWANGNSTFRLNVKGDIKANHFMYKR